MSQPQPLWSDDRKWWWDGSQWRPATEFGASHPPLAQPRSRSLTLPLMIGGGLVALVLAGVFVGGAFGPNVLPFGGEAMTVEGTGDYDSKVFTLNGGSYTVSWQVQQTARGVNVPCSIDANLWNEGGYYQRNLVTETSGPPDSGTVTLQIPPGRWSVEVINSCSDSHSVVQIRRASG